MLHIVLVGLQFILVCEYVLSVTKMFFSGFQNPSKVC